MSTKGLCIESDDELSEGMRILLFLNWPIPDRSGALMDLIAEGKVVRSDDLGVGVRFDRRPFFVRAQTNVARLQFLVPPGRLM